MDGSNEQGNWRAWPTSFRLWEKLKPLAREMRHEPTPAEHFLWHHLRSRKVNGLKFRRQYPIERFIVDFFCAEHRLVIEVDGNIHEYSIEEDAIRTEYLNEQGMRVIRFTNNDVLRNIKYVLEQIAGFCAND